jgi:hypothetical protein
MGRFASRSALALSILFLLPSTGLAQAALATVRTRADIGVDLNNLLNSNYATEYESN